MKINKQLTEQENLLTLLGHIDLSGKVTIGNPVVLTTHDYSQITRNSINDSFTPNTKVTLTANETCSHKGSVEVQYRRIDVRYIYKCTNLGPYTGSKENKEAIEQFIKQCFDVQLPTVDNKVTYTVDMDNKVIKIKAEENSLLFVGDYDMPIEDITPPVPTPPSPDNTVNGHTPNENGEYEMGNIVYGNHELTTNTED